MSSLNLVSIYNVVFAFMFSGFVSMTEKSLVFPLRLYISPDFLSKFTHSYLTSFFTVNYFLPMVFF